VALATLCLAMLLGAASASAVVIRSQVEAFGPDGTPASSFGAGRLRDLAFNQATRGLYAIDAGTPGVYGFNVSAPPAHTPLAGFSPLGTVATGGDPGLAVDNTALPSSGNVYFVSEATKLIYGFDKTGASLGGNFPIDPAITPGAPFGSPTDVCGAAVDSAGNVWVPNYNTRSILEYSSAGIYQATVSTAAQGFFPCAVAFDSNDDMYVTNGGDSSDATYKYTAASGYTAATLIGASSVRANAVDRSTHHVFLLSGTGVVNEYDSAGNFVSTTSGKDSTGDTVIPTPSGIKGVTFTGVAVDSANDRLYVSDSSSGKILAFGPALTYPDLTLGAASGVESTSATVNGTISAQGVALSDCHVEYVNAFKTAGFDDLSSGGSAPCSPAAGSIPVDSATHPVTATLSGLTPNAPYRFRLVAANANGAIATPEGTLETIGPPIVETTGSPVRTTTTARLDARLDPAGAATTYHFEYGDQGPCDANPCTATDVHPAGSGNEFELVSQQVEGLQPGATYHYRVIADNGNPAGASFGEDMTVTTFASEAPLSHGHLPGPPGSDRAWELVSAPDSGGNPVGLGFASDKFSIADAGDRAVYGVAGGTPDSETGTFATTLFAERTATGWQTKGIVASRDEATESDWSTPAGPSDLSEMISRNAPSGLGRFTVWRLTPDAPAQLLAESSEEAGVVGVSENASPRVLVSLSGTQDPEHPVLPGTGNIYDITSGSPKMIGLLPDGSVPACRVVPLFGGKDRLARVVSADGSLAFFGVRSGCVTGAVTQLYVRDIDAERTTLMSTPPVSGPACEASFLKSTPEAAFFYTEGRLVAKDVESTGCGAGSGDVYRYSLGDGSLDCVTCVVPGVQAGVRESSNSQIGVSEDGSRVYFRSSNRLLPGAALKEGIYRVDVASGDLAYVGLTGGSIGSIASGNLSHDGSVAVFWSSSPSLNALGGQQNAGTRQYYRYDDRDRSLTCVSCPADGSAPRGQVPEGVAGDGLGANGGSLSADGEDFAFSTPTSLAAADQNTAGAGQKPEAGQDVYEWRDGRLLLVSDGLANRPPGNNDPRVIGITPSGHDVFFIQAAQLTQDALDGYSRLYDARIGGGFEFPPPPKPCPLEVCQGIPKGAPEEQAPGTATIAGVGNAAAQKQHKAKKRHQKKRHKKHAKKAHRKANSNRGAGR
jgi:hypothetical protein